MRLVLLSALLAAGASAQPAPCVDGFAALPNDGPYPCRGVDLLAHLPLSAFAAPDAPTSNNDIWGWTDAQTGKEYALVGLSNGTAFVDVSVPTAPRRLGVLPTATVPSLWRDVKVLGDVAVVVSEAPDHGMQIFDLTRLRGLSEDAGRQFDADARYAGFGRAHNVVVNEETGFAYGVGSRPPAGADLPAACGERGFHAVDLSSPLTPAFAGCFSDAAKDTAPVSAPGYTHDAQCVVYDGPDADYTGREICVGSNEDVVTIFDVTDKSDVTLVSQAAYPRASYTHQGWLTEDRRYFLVDDELDEVNGLATTQRTLVLDVSDLDAPDFAFAYDSGLTTIDHNLYVRGGLVYQSNYEAGLRILDARRIGDGVLREVAYFDTYPSRTTFTAPCLPPNEGRNCSSFNGQWSNYPYFESGVVIANDADNGLFVLRPADEAPPPPDGARLSPPAPNPTRDDAQLTLRVGADQDVRVGLYDAAGRLVRTLYNGPADADLALPLVVRGEGLAAGVYLVRATGERFDVARRVTLTR